MSGVNLKGVQYEQIPNIVRRMRTQGQSLNTEFSNAYKSIIAMNQDWYGKRYEALAKGFIDMKQSIDNMLKIVVTELPKSLEDVANNYSQYDSGNNICTPQSTSIIPMPSISIDSKSGVRFILSGVQTTQKNVGQNFTKAVGFMNDIQKTFATITWESESANTFKKKFDELHRKVKKSIEDITDAFDKNMKSAINDIKEAERANTVN